MEAMASGLPTVCSRIGGIVDMIANEVDGLLTEPGDQPAVASALVRLHDDLELWERLSQSARRRAQTAFDARVLAQRMLDTIAHYRENGG
jgi:glycosyltransferase involved in cell wall biosynthesis